METITRDEINALSSKARNAGIILLRKEELRLEAECVSIQDRINDLQWRIEGADDYAIADLMHERQRAIDKLRETRKELYAVKEKLVDYGVM